MVQERISFSTTVKFFCALLSLLGENATGALSCMITAPNWRSLASSKCEMVYYDLGTLGRCREP
jgi:hypothetical protein